MEIKEIDGGIRKSGQKGEGMQRCGLMECVGFGMKWRRYSKTAEEGGGKR